MKKKIIKAKTIHIENLSDFNGTLKQLKKEINILIKQYGEDVKITVDAGYNNVSFFIEKN